MLIPIDKIFPNPEQPRTDFDTLELDNLAESIRQHGVINPVSVEGSLEGDIYILIDGERRTRAAKLAGLSAIEASVRAPMNGNGPRDRLTMALVANLQRADMNPIEEGEGYRHMMELGFSAEQISELVGVHKSTINFKLGFLSLEPEIRALIAQGKLPQSSQLTAALRSLSDEQRVRIARSLAAKGATIKTILMVCKRVANAGLRGNDRPIRGNKSPMTMLAEKYAETPKAEHWNMVNQARVEIDPAFRKAAEETCRECILFESASEQVCKECPAVTLLRKITKKELRA